MEILNIPAPSRTRLQAKLRLYKSEAEKMKRDLASFLCLCGQKTLSLSNQEIYNSDVPMQ